MIRHRLLAAVALMTLAAGAAQAQPRTTTPMTPVSPQAPASPTAPPSPTPGAPATAQGQPTTGTRTDAAPGPAATVPPAPASATPPAAPTAAAPTTTAPIAAAPAAFTPVTAGADIASTLKASGQFTTLLKAAEATGLTPVLATPGLTVFAPTDAAFAALPAGRLDNLMKQENLPQLQRLLTYHIVNAKIPQIRGFSATQVTTASGQKVTLDGTGEQVKVNDAGTLQPSVAAGSQTVYVIDKVLSPDYVPPPALAAEPEAAPAAEAPAAKSTTTRTPRRKR